jgi:multidrug efflux pump
VALTLSPVMASKLLHADESERGLAGKITHGFESLKKKYASLLDLTLRSRPFIYSTWIILSLLVVPMIKFSATELAPAEDQGFLLGIAETPASSTVDQTLHFSKQLFDVFKSTPEYNYTFQIATPSMAMGGLILKPWSERKRTAAQIMPSVQAEAAKIPGLNVHVVNRPALPSGGQFPVEFIIASTAEPERVLEFAKQLQQKAIESGLFPPTFAPQIDVKYDQPQVEFDIDRDKVAALGLNLQQIGQDIAIGVGGNYVNRFNVDGRSYKVIPQIKRIDRLNADQLKDIYVTGPNGQLIPLSTVATINHTVQPRSLNRFQQLNSVKISGVSIVPLDQALKFLEGEAAKILPKGYVIDYTGESRQLRKEGGNDAFVRTFVLAFVLIFLVLAAQFNSFRDPLIILFGSVPLAMFGASIFTFLKLPMPIPFFTDGWTTTFNIYAQVGLVTLVGLVSKNGILIVEFANELQRQGRPKIEAIREAALTRLRPILMTSAATVFGHLPLTLVTGAGAAARNSIGLIVVGGMSIGTLFTLFVVPSLYILIAKDHNKAQAASAKISGAPVLQPVLSK